MQLPGETEAAGRPTMELSPIRQPQRGIRVTRKMRLTYVGLARRGY